MAAPYRPPRPSSSAADPGMRSVAVFATGIAAVSVLLALLVTWRLIDARRERDRLRAECRCCDAAPTLEVDHAR